MKRVTVIVPMYNSSKYIGECLSSVDTKNADVICVNSGSTDNTVEIAQKFPVKIINSSFNISQGIARNIGLMATKTEYTMFLDSDDLFCKDTVSLMLEAVQGNTLAVCNTKTFGDFYRNYGTLKISGQRVLDYNSSLLTPVVCWNKIYRTDSIKDKGLWFPEMIPEDNAFWFCYSCANFLSNVNYVQEELYNYRIVENGSFAKQTKSVNPRYDSISIFFFMYDFLMKNNLHSHIKWLFESYFFNFISHYKHTTKKSDIFVLNRVSKELNLRNINNHTLPFFGDKIKKIIDKTYKI